MLNFIKIIPPLIGEYTFILVLLLKRHKQKHYSVSSYDYEIFCCANICFVVGKLNLEQKFFKNLSP